MAFEAHASPPEELFVIEVSNKVLRQIIEKIPDQQRLSYDCGGYPNIRIKDILYKVKPR